MAVRLGTVLTKGAAMIRKLVLVAYVVIGIIVASSHHYFTHLNGIRSILAAVLAVVLWPLVLLGVNLHLR
jgi:hypothetical protein